MNKKIITFGILGIFLLAGTLAFTILNNGTILIEESELEQVTNQQIENYMENNLQLNSFKKTPSKIIIYYNITYLEPTHSNPDYKVFTQPKPFIIENKLWDFCINKTTQNTCKEYLVDRTTPYYFIENNSYIKEVTEYNNVSKEREIEVYDEFGNLTGTTLETYYELEPYQVNKTFYEITNTTITSTYYKARQEQIRQYNRAIEFRDKAIENSLNDLGGLI